MRDDQVDALVSSDERLEVLGDRRQPSAAVDENRNRTLDGELEDRLEASIVEGERLGAGVELDASRTEVEAALRLLESDSWSDRGGRTG